MKEILIVLALILFGGACGAVGWFARGEWDGSTISTKDAAKDSQQFVDGAVEKNQGIVSAEGKADESRARTKTIIEKVYVDRACPPGTGAVSDDRAARLRIKFAPDKDVGKG